MLSSSSGSRCLANSDEYTSIKCGQGNRKYIFKKDNEERVKSKINSNRNKLNRKVKSSRIEDIDKYLLENHLNRVFGIIQFRDLFSKVFDIRGKRTVEGILRELNRNKRIESVGIGSFRVLSNRSDI